MAAHWGRNAALSTRLGTCVWQDHTLARQLPRCPHYIESAEFTLRIESAACRYLAGYFASIPISFGSFTLTSVGNGDIFVAKMDPSGNVVYAKSFGGVGSEEVRDIAVDSAYSRPAIEQQE